MHHLVTLLQKTTSVLDPILIALLCHLPYLSQKHYLLINPGLIPHWAILTLIVPVTVGLNIGPEMEQPLGLRILEFLQN
jgi:hypothetical protein